MRAIYVEITNACNLACSFCPSSTAISGARNFMDEPLFQKAMDQAAMVTDRVYFHVLGEPLAHPRFTSYLSIAGSKGLGVNLTTNGVMLPRHARSLLDAPSLRQINISLHALKELPDPALGLMYLRQILEFCRLCMANRPELYVNLRLWNHAGPEQHGHDQGDLPAPGGKTDKDWNRQVMDGISRTLGCPIPEEDFQIRRKSTPLTGRIYLHRDTRFEWPQETRNLDRLDTGTCHGLEDHAAILNDGRVVPCCLDWEGDLALGSIRTQNLRDILDSAKAQAMAQGFSQGILTERFCQTCRFCRRFPVASKLQIS